MSAFNDRIRRWIGSANATLHSSRGKDYLVFLLFLCVSYVFWLLLTLNNEIQEDLEVPVELVEIPDSITLISEIPPSIAVSVRDKGSSLARYVWGNTPTLRIRFSDGRTNDNRLVISESDIDSRLRSFFGQTSQIVSSKPDSISIYYTTQPGRRVKLDPKVDAHPSMQCVISGPITADVDSVTIYSVNDLPASLTSVQTIPIVRTGLSDTTYVEARISPVPNTRIIPDKVMICIPVEPLISKKRMIPLRVTGVPAGIELLTFPSQIEISYLIPMSLYSVDDEALHAVADYSSLLTPSGALSPKLAVKLPILPTFYHNVSLSVDSVEYIIEQKAPAQ